MTGWRCRFGHVVIAPMHSWRAALSLVVVPRFFAAKPPSIVLLAWFCACNQHILYLCFASSCGHFKDPLFLCGPCQLTLQVETYLPTYSTVQPTVMPGGLVGEESDADWYRTNSPALAARAVSQLICGTTCARVTKDTPVHLMLSLAFVPCTIHVA
nr:hypothetical protein CFP56_34953 [Quercus suber]